MIAADFHVRERIAGIIPRHDLPAGLNLGVEDTPQPGLSVIDRLVEPHQVNYRTAGLDHLGKGIIRTLLFIAPP